MFNENIVTEVVEVQTPASETTALIKDPRSNGQEASTKKHAWTYVKLFAIYFLCNVGLQILSPAQILVYERIYCSQWYQKHGTESALPLAGIPESWCKISPIQQQVATLKGWLEFFIAAPGLLWSVPMGILADAIGRRRLAFVTLLTFFLSEGWNAFISYFGGQIPLHFVWFGALITAFGGGGMVGDMILMCMFSDISPSDKLTAVFLRVTAFEAVGRVLGPTIAASLMQWNAWWAICTGLAFILLGVLLTLTVPETLQTSEQEGSESTEESTPVQSWGLPSKWENIQQSMRELVRIWSDWRLIFVGLTYPFRSICFALDDLVQRYVSNRYGWTLADATFTYSIEAVGSGIMLFTILPMISTALDRRTTWSVIHKNALMSRASLLVLTISFLVIGLAPTVPILIVGLLIETISVGLPAALRALAAGLVPDEDHGRVFSMLAALETINMMVAFPVSAKIFNIGLEKGGGTWLGLPYDILAGVSFLAFLTMCATRFERRLELSGPA